MIFSVSDDCRPARDTDGDVSTPHSGLHGCALATWPDTRFVFGSMAMRGTPTPAPVAHNIFFKWHSPTNT